MLHSVPEPVLARMRVLEAIDQRDRADGTPHMRRLRQISPEVGRFIAILAATAPPGRMIEVGTSAGYSTLWLSLASQVTGRRITTFEILPEKVEIARQTFAVAGVADLVDLIAGDARTYLPHIRRVSFCFLDAEKETYAACYEAIVPNLVPGGILIADNAISHESTLRPMLDRALADDRVDAVIVPIGRGELLCRRVSPAPSA